MVTHYVIVMTATRGVVVMKRGLVSGTCQFESPCYFLFVRKKKITIVKHVIPPLGT